VTRAYRVLLFDLFGTVVHFVPPPPGAARGTFEWLRAPLAEHQPAVPFEEFRLALVEVSRELVGERATEHREVPSRERFRRVLGRFAAADPAAAEALSLAHMAHLAAQTTMPAAHGDLLRELSARYRLGLVSNFDHAPTARAILARCGVQHCFDVTLISDDFGRRKPHPSIFREALTRLTAAPADALYVGDTPADDIVGARAAGLDVAWINRLGDDPPDPGPTYTLRDLTELRGVLLGPPKSIRRP
jgi:putative hydrolase of the HAD superfamily